MPGYRSTDHDQKRAVSPKVWLVVIRSFLGHDRALRGSKAIIGRHKRRIIYSRPVNWLFNLCTGSWAAKREKGKRNGRLIKRSCARIYGGRIIFSFFLWPQNLARYRRLTFPYWKRSEALFFSLFRALFIASKNRKWLTSTSSRQLISASNGLSMESSLWAAIYLAAIILEKIPWEGEFTVRSDPWAGLIASSGSF